MELLGISLILILVIALSLLYVNYTAKFESVPEGYRNKAAAECEKKLGTCLSDEGTLESCTSEYNTCIADDVTSKNTGEKKEAKTPEIDPEYTGLAASALRGEKIPTAFEKYMKEIESKIGSEYPKPSQTNLDLAQGGGVNPTDEEIAKLYKQYQDLIKAQKESQEKLSGKKSFAEFQSYMKDIEDKLGAKYEKPTDKEMVTLYKQYQEIIKAQQKDLEEKSSTTFDKFMKEIKGRLSVEYPSPILTNLDLAQGSGINPTEDEITNIYKQYQAIIKAHQQLPEQKPSLTIEQPNAPDIPLTQTSLRQQIRDDIKKAVKEEIDTIDNEYEIKYVTE
jgi:hypothetical protein